MAHKPQRTKGKKSKKKNKTNKTNKTNKHSKPRIYGYKKGGDYNKVYNQNDSVVTVHGLTMSVDEYKRYMEKLSMQGPDI